MKEIHILVTGIGRRVELVQAFREAALNLKVQLKLYGADITGTAPALFYCDFTRKVCAMDDPRYIQQLIEICINDKIDLIVPTIDTDLLVLSRNVDKFEDVGTKVLISKEEKIQICRDKNYTGDFFRSCGVKAPKTCNNYQEYRGKYPCFIKPKDGSSSINAYKVENQDELAVYASQIKDYIIQPYIDGREFTVDIFCDFDGNPIYITPRERLQVRAGEVLKTCIHVDEKMIEESKRIVDRFKPCGPMTIQLIKEKETGVNYYIEINPRYGGGAPLSMKAGARSAESLLKLLCGQKVEYEKCIANNGAIYSRFDQSVCISPGYNTQQIKGVIFDLDDTLYNEKEYVKSGYKQIAKFLGRPDAEMQLWELFLKKQNAIDVYLEQVGLTETKLECLKRYRNQIPEIRLLDGVFELMNSLKKENINIGIITDGRSVSQRNKINVLGLDRMVSDIIVTDELGGVQFRKPNDISFRIMQNRWGIPFEQMVYIGDNVKKDFIAPRKLGMRSLCLKNKDGIYYEKNAKYEIDTVETIGEVYKKIIGEN